MSTRDIEAALTETLEVEGVSKSTVSTLCGQLKHDFERWQNRDLSDVDLLYLFCDGIYLRLRPEDPKAVAVLVRLRDQDRRTEGAAASGGRGQGEHGLLEELL